jgi:regulator of nonsense transcripts 2
MSGLNLTKYVGELASALLEAKLKMSDVVAAVEFCSAVHQKVSPFSGTRY